MEPPNCVLGHCRPRKRTLCLQMAGTPAHQPTHPHLQMTTLGSTDHTQLTNCPAFKPIYAACLLETHRSYTTSHKSHLVGKSDEISPHMCESCQSPKPSNYPIPDDRSKQWFPLPRLDDRSERRCLEKLPAGFIRGFQWVNTAGRQEVRPHFPLFSSFFVLPCMHRGLPGR